MQVRRFLGDDFRICRIQRFLVRQWLPVSVNGGVENFTYFYAKVDSDPEVVYAFGRNSHTFQREGEFESMAQLDEFYTFSL